MISQLCFESKEYLTNFLNIEKWEGHANNLEIRKMTSEIVFSVQFLQTEDNAVAREGAENVKFHPLLC